MESEHLPPQPDIRQQFTPDVLRKAYGVLLPHRHFLESRGHDVKDVLHKAVIRALETKNTWDPSLPFDVWFKTIVRNTLKDLFRWQKYRDRNVEYDDERASHSEDTIERLETRDELKATHQKISGLKQEYQEALEHAQAGLDQKDVAKKLGITENNAKLRLHHARKALKKVA